MAEEAVDTVQRSLGRKISWSRTRQYRLFGFEDDKAGAVAKLTEKYPLPQDTIRHLVAKFGNCTPRILDLVVADPTLGEPLVGGAPQIQAEVVYSVREEMAMCIEDILSRRLGLQFYDWRLAIQAAPVVASILARELGWTRSRLERDVQQYIDQIRASSEAVGMDLVHTEN
jgi:glycerol-3-phosphate dehydrogenase